MAYIVASLTLLGAVTVLFIVVFTFIALKEYVSDLIRRLKWRSKYKHRFDKQPLAKCYCKDCKNYCTSSGDCIAHVGWKVADSWFCWEAVPKKYDPEKD